jgi:hypothetical protein
MRVQLQTDWFRILFEIFEPRPALSRYRMISPRLDGPVQRQLQRRIRKQLRPGP